MSSQFPAYIPRGGPVAGGEPFQYEATFLSTDVSQPGEFVFFDTGDNNVKECGADPALILGLCTGNAPASVFASSATSAKPQPYATNTAPVEVLSPNTIVALSSTTTPSLAFLYRKGGLTKVVAGQTNIWQCDTSKTAGTARFVIVGIDIPSGTFFVRFLPANLQGQSIAS